MVSVNAIDIDVDQSVMAEEREKVHRALATELQDEIDDRDPVTLERGMNRFYQFIAFIFLLLIQKPVGDLYLVISELKWTNVRGFPRMQKSDMKYDFGTRHDCVWAWFLLKMEHV